MRRAKEATTAQARGLAYRRVALWGVVFLGVCALAAHFVPTGQWADFANYYDAGRKALIGQIQDLYDPTAAIGGAPPQAGMQFVGTPISSYLYAPMGLLPPLQAMFAFKAANTVGLTIALYLIYQRTRPQAGPDLRQQAIFAALFVAMLFVFQPFWTYFRVGGQTTSLILLLLVVAWRSHIAGRFWIESACLVAACAIKPFLAPSLLLLALTSGPGFVLRLGMTGALAVAAAVAIMGWPVHQSFLHELARQARILSDPMWSSALTVWIDALWVSPEALEGMQPRPDGLVALISVIQLSVVVLFIWLVRDRRAQAMTFPERRSLRFVQAILLALLFTPTVWEHYLTLLVLLFAPLLAARREVSRTASLLVWLVIILAAGQNTVLLHLVETIVGGIDTRPEEVALSIFKSLPLLLVLAFVLTQREALHRAFAVSPTPVATA